jgi:hypothetical protein
MKGFTMPFDARKFTALYDQFLQIDFTGTERRLRPPLANARDVRAATAKGAPHLPLIYRQNFHQPMDARLANLLKQLQQDVKNGDKTAGEALARLESFYAPIYQHGANVTSVKAGPQLRRFLAVVSNLFRSFADHDKRAAAGVNLVTSTPPLAFFQSDSGDGPSGQGPYTIESDLMKQHFGIEIGIVSLPATYRDHPVIWSVLSHEVCGHDVVHADAGLLQEMTAAAQALLAPDFAPRKRLDHATLNALIWSYWMDEAAADVYGALNMGPAFAPSLAAFLAAFRGRLDMAIHGAKGPAKPVVSTGALQRDAEGGDHIMEDHPIDLLRVYLVLGAVEAMTRLDKAKRDAYVAAIEEIARLVAGDATSVHLEGIVNLAPGMRVPVRADIPVDVAADAARKVGRMIATQKFKALNGHSIQDIETWDDADEAAAEAIAALIAKDQSIVAHGDDAQLLAGATLALLQQAELYDKAQALLNSALDDSFRTDPIWRGLSADHAFPPHVFRKPKPQDKVAAARVKPAATKKRKR